MEITIFSKKGTTKDGRNFTRYLTQLTKKTTGEVITMGVKFREAAGVPEVCPCNINVTKAGCNISLRNATDRDGNPIQYPTLWVSEWVPGSPYEDHSTDEFF